VKCSITALIAKYI